MKNMATHLGFNASIAPCLPPPPRGGGDIA